MLLEQLKELMEFGFVDKHTYEGYPLRVEYFLTKPNGEKIIEALSVMQSIGIDYFKSNGMEQILIDKGIIWTESTLQKSK